MTRLTSSASDTFVEPCDACAGARVRSGTERNVAVRTAIEDAPSRVRESVVIAAGGRERERDWVAARDPKPKLHARRATPLSSVAESSLTDLGGTPTSYHVSVPSRRSRRPR